MKKDIFRRAGRVARRTDAELVAPPAAGTFVVPRDRRRHRLAIFVEGADFSLLYDAGSNDDFARGAPPAPARATNRVVAYLRAVRPDLPPLTM